MEHPLIRLIMQGVGWGGTVSNGNYTGLFNNPTGNALTITLDYSNVYGLATGTAQVNHIIPAGGNL
ncbi:hypothetical protein [uncultured Shewanella sp.]|uniref:hypothetical protein n=1 Tax=uncultured Shewanella sp. TaxID=173975 RepID=UPI00263A2D14|nr:hypothetical protein [uncultured Shewanella sp.]